MTPFARSWPLPCLALALGACDLGLDPSMVGGEGGSSSSGPASSSVTGPASSSGTATGSSSASGGEGGAGGGGQGGVGGSSTSSSTGAGGTPITWVPCAPPEDFEAPFSLSDPADNWVPTGQVTTVNQGDVLLRLEANTGETTFARDVPSMLTECFLSLRLEETGNDQIYLMADCEPGVVRFMLDSDTKMLAIQVTDPPEMTPTPTPVNLGTEPNVPATMRVRFEGPGDDIVFELKEQGDVDFTTYLTMQQPDWMTSCLVGIGTTSNTAVRVDDICLDPP